MAQVEAEALCDANGGDEKGLNVLVQLFNRESGEAKPATKTATTRRKTIASATSSSSSSSSLSSTTTTTTTTRVRKDASGVMASSATTTKTTTVSSPLNHEGWTSKVYGYNNKFQMYSPSSSDEGLVDTGAGGSFGASPSSSRLPPDFPFSFVKMDLEKSDVLFVLFDTETTGLFPQGRIVQIGAKVLDWVSKWLLTSAYRIVSHN